MRAEEAQVNSPKGQGTGVSSRRLVTCAECLPCTRHHAGCSPSHPKGHGCLPQTRDEIRKADKLVFKPRLIQKKKKKPEPCSAQASHLA